MDRTLQMITDRMDKYMDKTEFAIGKVVDIAIEETPKVIHEYLTWKVYVSVFYCIMPILFLSSTVYATKKSWIKANFSDLYWNRYATIGLIGLISSIVSAIWVIIAWIDYVPTIIQIWIAPRVYLIDQLGNFIKH